MRTTDIAAEASTFVDILEHRALHEPDRSGYIFLADRHRQELRLSYGELMRRARTIAVHIQDFAAPGDRVLLMYPSGLEFIVALFACLYAGTVAVPLYLPRAKTLARIQDVAYGLNGCAGAYDRGHRGERGVTARRS